MEENDETYELHMDLVSTEVIRLWESRRKAQGLNIDHKKTKELQLEFLLGAIAILDHMRNDGKSCVPPLIYFSAIRGEYIK